MSSRVRPGGAGASGSARDLAPGVRHVIPVASGKGGVGKSTVSANLAAALAGAGASVGLMDLDVYGPSIPAIMGAGGEVAVTNGRVIPPVVHGVKVVSMGFFMREGEAMIWRGPLLHRVVEQFLGEVEWGELDYLIVDFPPGTGDVQISFCHLGRPTGAVIVSTPQDAALAVARKAVDMFGKLEVPVLGLIENMSHFVCPHCGKREDVFGSGGARAAADRAGLAFLGEVPLASPVRESGDRGVPIVLAAPDSPAGRAFSGIAARTAAAVSTAQFRAGALRGGTEGS